MLFEDTTGNTISNRAKFETINNTRTTRSKKDHPELHWNLVKFFQGMYYQKEEDI